MDTLDEGKLAQAERAIAAVMVTEFGLDLSALALDMTNFATFIDSANEKAPITQRGHAKQKRVDLRLVGLGLVVTRDGGVPVVGLDAPTSCQLVFRMLVAFRARGCSGGLGRRRGRCRVRVGRPR